MNVETIINDELWQHLIFEPHYSFEKNKNRILFIISELAYIYFPDMLSDKRQREQLIFRSTFKFLMLLYIKNKFDYENQKAVEIVPREFYNLVQYGCSQHIDERLIDMVTEYNLDHNNYLGVLLESVLENESHYQGSDYDQHIYMSAEELSIYSDFDDELSDIFQLFNQYCDKQSLTIFLKDDVGADVYDYKDFYHQLIWKHIMTDTEVNN